LIIWGFGDSVIWGFVYLGTCLFGDLFIWGFGYLGICLFGDLVIWGFGYSSAQGCVHGTVSKVKSYGWLGY